MRRLLVCSLFAAVLLSATPALAISSITNSFSSSDYSVSTGQQVKL